MPWWRVRQIVGRGARRAYRGLPLPLSIKVVIKDWCYRLLGGLFSGSTSYREWRLQRDAQTLGPLPAGPLEQYLTDLFTRSARTKSAQEWVPFSSDGLETRRLSLRLIAFYLPQFHPIPENDRWWGRGFTEWTSVSGAVPQFVGHHQPRLPGELGFYDLRLLEVQRRQIELARHYGIHGFCYYVYWFSGRRLLERPLQQVLQHQELDFPFCVCWANENWTRRWDGLDDDVLIAQRYGPEDDQSLVRDLAPLLADSRYIRVDGKPLVLVYRASLLPDLPRRIAAWRRAALEAGLGELFLAAVLSFDVDPLEAVSQGFDAVVEFPPHKLKPRSINTEVQIVNPEYRGVVFDYREVVATEAVAKRSPVRSFRGVMPGWDNEARRPGQGFSFAHASPNGYARWLRAACAEAAQSERSDGRLVFVNAWNEWSEGAYLEPDARFGYAYLKATASVLREFAEVDARAERLIERSQVPRGRQAEVAVIVHAYYEDLLDELMAFVANVGPCDVYVSFAPGVSGETVERLRERWPTARLYAFPNRGRDILPFLRILPTVVDLAYPLAVKVHSKRSLHRDDGDAWRRAMLGSLLGSPRQVQSVKERFERSARTGMVIPKESRLSLAVAEYRLGNEPALRRLVGQLGNDTGALDFDFAAGSMFWFRPTALRRLVRLGLSDGDFAEESGQLDGTMAHAIERIFAYAATQEGYTVEDG